MDACHDHFLIKVSIGDGGEQVHGDEMIGFRTDLLSQAAQMGGDSGNAAGHID